MSFLLDPPALFILGVFVYFFSKRYYIKRLWVVRVGFIIVSVFIVYSLLLYLDVIRWQIPYLMDMPGSEWMFHSNLTGIYKTNVPVPLVVIMFGLYPFWYYIGYISAQYLSRKTQLDKTVYNSSHVRSLQKPRKDDFSVKRGRELRKLLHECLSELGGIEWFVKKGDRVLIKPNICGGNPGRLGSYTSVDVIDELTKLVREAGGNPVIVDADMIWTEFCPVAKEEGYIDWAKNAKARLLNLSKTKLGFFDFGGMLDKTVISKELLNADVIISVPAMKTHMMTGVTLGMKNMYGTFPQMDKAVFHNYGIEEVIFEVNKAFPPNLTIIDGFIGGEGMGPLSSESVNFHTLVVSGNVVVADSIACKLMGFEPLEIKHIRLAYEAGLGNANVEFDIESLSPHDKDGCWVRPSVNVARFYNEVIETVLTFPGLETFFNLLADFILYDTATLPIFRNLTPELELILNDIFDALKLSGRIKK